MALNQNAPPGPEHACHLGERSGRVGDVFDHLVAVDEIEGGILERDMFGVPVADTQLDPQAFAYLRRRFACRGVWLHTDNVATRTRERRDIQPGSTPEIEDDRSFGKAGHAANAIQADGGDAFACRQPRQFVVDHEPLRVRGGGRILMCLCLDHLTGLRLAGYVSDKASLESPPIVTRKQYSVPCRFRAFFFCRTPASCIFARALWPDCAVSTFPRRDHNPRGELSWMQIGSSTLSPHR